MDITNIVFEKLCSVLDKLKRENNKTIVFLKGFPALYYKLLRMNGYEALGSNKWLNEEGYIDVRQLEADKNNLLIKFLTKESNFLWGFYEEFIALSNMINDIKTQYKGTIIILENNLFDKYYPLDIENDIISKLSSYFNNESSDITDDILVYTNYYSSVEFYPEGQVGLAYINRHEDEDIKSISFYETEADLNVNEKFMSSYKITARDPYIFCLKNYLQRGIPIGNIQIIIDGKIDEKAIMPFVNLLTLTKTQFRICRNERFKELTKEDGDKYTNILHKYWEKGSSFRNLLFYKNPDISNELVEISQGHIISDIISQCEIAISGSNGYSDIFITSPTGSGKSLLFQIPAIYLSEKYKAVTIVITPLIALMVDQVTQLTDLGLENVTFVNSDIPFDEKERRLKKIKEGEYSIVYLSPELFLANSIESLIGERRIGLLVIDEAHLVTTWGRDFRADYWYLGEYIEKLRKLNHDKFNFPVLCLTATAVYMGTEDTVNDTIVSLSLRNPKIYLGNVKRNNIHFEINKIDTKSITGSLENFKIEKTKENIIKCIDNNIKCIVYCPYTTQVEDVFNSLNEKYKKRVGKYYGSFDKYEKSEAQYKFKYGDYTVMISTKAFGMGVDIKDIEKVYHLAPTGNLADYVQEIGRAARNQEIKGIAATDFTSNDLKYVRMLYGLSGMKQYQLKEMIRKLYNIYKEKKSRNLLISPEAFSYLFDENDLENKVKSGLLLLSKDFENKYGFPVLVVRPKSLFTKNFVNVPFAIEKEFLKEYGRYARLIEDDSVRIIPSFNSNFGDTYIYNTGHIYEINMSELWEKHFNYLTFAQFKKKFFEGELFKFNSDEKLSPRLNLKITYHEDFEIAWEKLKKYSENLVNLFSELKSKRQVFTKNKFKEKFKEYFGNIKNNEIPGIVLDMFVADISQNIGFNQNADKFKFIQQRREMNQDEIVYRIMNSSYVMLKNYLSRLISSCKPQDNSDTFSTYIAITNNSKRPDLIYLAVLLELFGLASYEVIGGKNTEIFVRINDPVKLRRFASQNYSNSILTEIERKRRRSQEVLIGFMSSDLSDEERWNVIENYFLGRDDEVSRLLKLKES
ncbi:MULTISPECIES: DEAD/DEAH box helicase [Thermoanaerobacter]|jgi:RecQ family ATP-dependent DNA helicase|uniref:DEAD/DEAH box helicase domain protein n=2 Tax=Thermoanaerobacter TaxID=1754 RepID=B0K8W6_THEP3|nr:MULTISPECIES: DEAD/DEAH box helicase [Thermoanaerobacter]ABY94579.1 DEAD/DEAH box helicase domain protein [Thermoanaerobacter pseudethanolicus ATCC 33223]ADV79529.1 DEAD/DEAH box helicase domain protein [Thermoanaerobacter brockii subsp. finnii Ako-1]